jgi:hypothetical protein
MMQRGSHRRWAVLLCALLFAAAAPAEDWQRKAVELYPQLGVADSAFSKKFQRLRRLRKASDPKFFEKPEWPVILAKECAAQLEAGGKGNANAKAPQAPAAKEQPDMPADKKLYIAKCGRCHDPFDAGVDEMTWNRSLWKWKDKARLTDDEYDQLMAYARREREARQKKPAQ